MFLSTQDQILIGIVVTLLSIFLGARIERSRLKKERRKFHKKLSEIIDELSKIPPSRDNPHATRLRKELIKFGLNSDHIMHSSSIQRITFLKLIKLILEKEVPQYKHNNELINQEIASFLNASEKDIVLYELGQKNINDNNRNRLLDYYDLIIEKFKIDITKLYLNGISSK